MIDLSSLQSNRKFLLLDGALGTYIEECGCRLHKSLWSAETLARNPQLISSIHYDYLSAQCNIITTATYQVSYEGFFNTFGYSNQETNQLMQKSVTLAKETISRYRGDFPTSINKAYVAASIGSYGAHLADGSEFRGDYQKTASQLAEWHFPKLEVLSNTDADLIAFETFPCLTEDKAILDIMSSVEKSRNVGGWFSVSCDSSVRLCSGETVEDLCRLIEDRESDDSKYNLKDSSVTYSGQNSLRYLGLGVNCTNPLYTKDIIETMRECINKVRTLVAYPNRGCTWNPELVAYDDSSGMSDDQFAYLASSWVDAGAKIVGGCCKTNPGTIKAIADYISG